MASRHLYGRFVDGVRLECWAWLRLLSAALLESITLKESPPGSESLVRPVGGGKASSALRGTKLEVRRTGGENPIGYSGAGVVASTGFASERS